MDVEEINTNTVIYRDKPNTYEFGKAGNRFKLHFNTPEDLKKQMDELEKMGLFLNNLE